MSAQQERTERVARLYRENASVSEIAVTVGLARSTVRERLRSVGLLQPVSKSRRQEDEEEILRHAVRVDRDPCSFCGVRGDIGCSHRRGRW